MEPDGAGFAIWFSLGNHCAESVMHQQPMSIISSRAEAVAGIRSRTCGRSAMPAIREELQCKLDGREIMKGNTQTKRKTQTCRGPCRRTWDLEGGFNRKKRKGNQGIDASIPYQTICIGCTQTIRDQRKQKDRWIVKAGDTINRHAVRLGYSTSVLKDHYQWNSKHIAHYLEHAYKNGCHYCHKLYRDMGHGFTDITIDIIDPRIEPYFHTNVTHCCSTCNRQKSQLSPEAWCERLKYWAKYEVAMAGRDPDSWEDLFDGWKKSDQDR
jgi:hypothetical protein